MAMSPEARRDQRAPNVVPRVRAGSPGSPAARAILQLQRTAGNRAVAQAIASVQREDQKPDVVSGADKAAPRRTTGFLGLNPGADKEAAKLKKMTREDVLESYNDPVAEARFQKDPEIMNFIWDELGISKADVPRTILASSVLLNANVHMREQLVDMMRWFSKAENGDILLDRLVLSGHSNGVELWGESQEGRVSQPGKMVIDRDLQAIANVFPKAAGQVEDIMFSACFSIAAVELVVKVFPNLQNAWSYTSFSPSIKQGSAEHVAGFAEATEGGADLNRSDRKGSSALWTRKRGYIVGDPSLAAAGPLYARALGMWRDVAGAMYDGSGPDLTSDQLMPVYLPIQQMIAHPGTPADRKERGKQVMQILLRLRFWPLVRKRFGVEYKDKLQPAYDALGMTQPDWGSLTRKAMKTHVDAVMKALKDKPEASSHKDLLEKYLTEGIFLLKDESVIHTDWI